MYIWIEQSEDGAPSIRKFKSSDTLEKEIAELLEDGVTPKFLAKFPESDDGYWAEQGIVLIKGEIIVPKPKQVVTKYEI